MSKADFDAKPHYIVYGYIDAGRTTHNVSGEFWKLDDAEVHLVSQLIKHPGKLKAVIVFLTKGYDRNGEREIVQRINNGRTWWEEPFIETD